MLIWKQERNNKKLVRIDTDNSIINNTTILTVYELFATFLTVKYVIASTVFLGQYGSSAELLDLQKSG